MSLDHHVHTQAGKQRKRKREVGEERMVGAPFQPIGKRLKESRTGAPGCSPHAVRHRRTGGKTCRSGTSRIEVRQRRAARDGNMTVEFVRDASGISED